MAKGSSRLQLKLRQLPKLSLGLLLSCVSLPTLAATYTPSYAPPSTTTTTTTTSTSNTTGPAITSPQPHYGAPPPKYRRITNYKGEPRIVPVQIRPKKPHYFGLKSGPYLGIFAGYDSYKTYVGSQETSALSTVSSQTNINATGLVGGLVAGYGIYFKHIFYVGAEVTANLSAAEQTVSATSYDGTSGNGLSINNQMLVSNGYTLAFRPGVKLNSAGMLYFRFAYNLSEIALNHTVLLNGDTVHARDDKGWYHGFAYGLGLEVAMDENFTLRSEFMHTDYGDFVINNTKFSPCDNQFSLGLSYHFF